MSGFDLELLTKFDRKVNEAVCLKEEISVLCHDVGVIGRRIQSGEKISQQTAYEALLTHLDKLHDRIERLGVLSGAIAISPVIQSGRPLEVGDDDVPPSSTATCVCAECLARRGERGH